MNGASEARPLRYALPLDEPAEAAGRARGSPSDLLRRVMREPIGLIGAVIIVALIVVAIAAPLIAPYTVDEQPGDRLESPSSIYWLGTDEFGRDIFSRLVYGARVSLQVGIIAVGIALAIGG